MVDETGVRTSTTVVFPGPRQAELVEGIVPQPGPDQIVVETLVSLISTGTELTAYSGDFPPNSAWSGYVRYPFAAGYCNVGRVVEVGADITELRPGDRVASGAAHTTRACLDVGETRHGLAARSTMRVPEGVSDEAAAFFTLGCTVMNGVRLGEIKLGEAVVVIGAGLIGQLAVAMAALCGAWPLIVIDVAEQRLALARARGATHTVAADSAAARETVQQILGGRGADVVFEVTGNPQVIPDALRLARRRGRVVFLGSPRGSSQVDFHDEVHTLGLHLIGAHITTTPEYETPDTPWTQQRNGALFFDLVAAGRLRVGDLVTHRYPYREASAAYEFLFAERSRAMGVILTYP